MTGQLFQAGQFGNHGITRRSIIGYAHYGNNDHKYQICLFCSTLINVVSAMVKQPAGEVANRLAGGPGKAFAISIVVPACRVALRHCPQGPAQTDPSGVQAVLEGIGILPMEEPVDHHYGNIRAELARPGQPIGHNDPLIAARALGLALVTDNVRQFGRVAELVVENWLTVETSQSSTSKRAICCPRKIPGLHEQSQEVASSAGPIRHDAPPDMDVPIILARTMRCVRSLSIKPAAWLDGTI
ncbi:MAG TPA: hypothetical protein VGC24_02830, partial [Burkholderiaceae bacterium]